MMVNSLRSLILEWNCWPGWSKAKQSTRSCTCSGWLLSRIPLRTEGELLLARTIIYESFHYLLHWDIERELCLMVSYNCDLLSRWWCSKAGDCDHQFLLAVKDQFIFYLSRYLKAFREKRFACDKLVELPLGYAAKCRILLKTHSASKLLK